MPVSPPSVNVFALPPLTPQGVQSFQHTKVAESEKLAHARAFAQGAKEPILQRLGRAFIHKIIKGPGLLESCRRYRYRHAIGQLQQHLKKVLVSDARHWHSAVLRDEAQFKIQIEAVVKRPNAQPHIGVLNKNEMNWLRLCQFKRDIKAIGAPDRNNHYCYQLRSNGKLGRIAESSPATPLHKKVMLRDILTQMGSTYGLHLESTSHASVISFLQQLESKIRAQDQRDARQGAPSHIAATASTSILVQDVSKDRPPAYEHPPSYKNSAPPYSKT